MKKLLLCTLFLTLGSAPAAKAQVASTFPYRIWGTVSASAFGAWKLRSESQTAGPGITTLHLDNSTPPTVLGGPSFQPLSTNAPLAIGVGAQAETAVPSGVACSAGQCSVTLTLATDHTGLLIVQSATGGLQEAIDFQQRTGGMVVIDETWAGSNDQLASATGFANVPVVDERKGGLALYGWNGTAYVAAAAAASGASTPGVSVGALTAAFPAIGPTSIERVQFASDFSGPDAGAQINAAIAALPAAGGTVSLRGFGAKATLATAVTISKPVRLVVGNTEFSMQAPITFEAGSDGSAIVGSGWTGARPLASYFIAGANLPALIQVGSGAGTVRDIELAGIGLDGASRATNAILLATGAVFGTIRNVGVFNCVGAGIASSSSAGTFDWRIEKSRAERNGTGIAVSGVNEFFLADDNFSNNSQYGISITDASKVAVEGGDIEGNGSEDIHLVGGNAYSIADAYFEPASSANAVDIHLAGGASDPTRGLVVQGNYAAATGSPRATHAVMIDASSLVDGVVIGNHFDNFVSAVSNASGNSGVALQNTGKSPLFDSTAGWIVVSGGAATSILLLDAGSGSQSALSLKAARGSYSIALNNSGLQIEDLATGRTPLAVSPSDGLVVGGGSPLTQPVSATATLSPGTVKAQSCVMGAIAVPGANVSRSAAQVSPNGALGSSTVTWSAWVQSAGTVAVSICNPSSSSVALNAVSWTVWVLQ
ncbi:MAG: right-handed parallel beta-helix repeat-containing protein [Terriglobales bacterium]